MQMAGSVRAAWVKTWDRLGGWLEARSLPASKRLARYPLRALYYFLSDRLLEPGLRLATTFWGAPITIPVPRYRSIYHHGVIDGRELVVTDFLTRRLQPGTVFLDVGANIGFYSMLALAANANVFAFEPVPSIYDFLAWNAPGAVRYKIALSDETGTAKFADFGVLSGEGSLVSSSSHMIIVQTQTLDQWFAQHRIVPDVIKIDVEGAEMRVLRGAAQTLSAHHPDVIIEVNEPAVVPFMASLGYQAYELGIGCRMPYQGGKKAPNILFTRQ